MATLEQIIEEARKLPAEEQRQLRAALETLESNGDAQPANQKSSPQKPQSLYDNTGDEQIRQRRMEWLKSHREEYGGQYVALDGDVLVGHGATIGEAHQQAKGKGVENPFLVRLTSENEILSAGW
ncbi:MAG: DUF5678 domain-containing protein [Pyrinomonadaceae bacterium]